MTNGYYSVWSDNFFWNLKEQLKPSYQRTTTTFYITFVVSGWSADPRTQKQDNYDVGYL